MVVARPSEGCGTRAVSRTGTSRDFAAPDDPGVGLPLPDESVAVGDGAPGHSSNLTRYYAASGTPPGVFLGAGLAGLDNGRGVEHGSEVTEQHLFNLLGMCADPVTGQPLGRQPNRAHLSLSKRWPNGSLASQRPTPRPNGPRREPASKPKNEQGRRLPHAGGRVRPDLLALQVGLHGLGPGRSGHQGADLRLPSPGHRRWSSPTPSARCSTHARAPTRGPRDIEGVVAAAFTHWDSRAGTPSSTTMWWWLTGRSRSPTEHGARSIREASSSPSSRCLNCTKACSVTY